MIYVPFLKYKVNEVSALKALELNDIERVTPFFDLPRRDDLDSEILRALIDTAYRKYEINLKKLPCFYIDNFDIEDDILIDGDDNYSYVLNKFSTVDIIPVIGIDRTHRRNQVVINAKLSTDTVALRVGSEDLVSYKLIQGEIDELLELVEDGYPNFHLIIDNRVCHNIDAKVRAVQISDFIRDISRDVHFEKIIVAGSSIPASIRDLLPPNSSITIDRVELDIFRRVAQEFPSIVVGDYTSVSPNYSDVKIRGEYMRKVTAPKIMYSFDEQLHIKRGGAIEGHPRGNKQYNDLSAQLVNEQFFRGANYSFGDKYIVDKANDIGNDATPSTIPKALINAHITFMLNDFK